MGGNGGDMMPEQDFAVGDLIGLAGLAFGGVHLARGWGQVGIAIAESFDAAPGAAFLEAKIIHLMRRCQLVQRKADDSRALGDDRLLSLCQARAKQRAD